MVDGVVVMRRGERDFGGGFRRAGLDWKFDGVGFGLFEAGGAAAGCMGAYAALTSDLAIGHQ